jgi:tetratricopeptide (TPR) repeat protein
VVATHDADRLLAQANQLLRAGRVPEAIEAHQRLLALRPKLPDSWYNLAYLQQHARQYDAALASYQRALDCGVGQPEEVHLNRAVILADCLARLDDAEREFGRALQRNPRYVPALVNLGNLHEQRGDRERAIDAYERALALEPNQALALARLPNVKPLARADDPLIARLRQALSRRDLTTAERADLGFGLGKALDSVGAYDEAFAAYSAANQASRASAGPRPVRYDPVAHERYVDRLIRAFPARSESMRAFAAPVAPPAATSGRPPPIFICGMFRSGSTLAEQILASHPRVSAGGEIGLLPAIARQYLVPAGDAFAPLDAATLERLRRGYLDGVYALFPTAERVTDKRPDNFLNIGLIKALFPEAKIVHTRRNALDNCLSVFFLHLDHSMSYSFDLRDIAHWYRQYERVMAHWKKLYGASIHDVDYDALVTDLRPTVERMLAYCELPWDDACLSFHTTRTIVKTPSAWQVRQPLYTRASGRWRHYERHLHELRAALDAGREERT